MDEPDRPERTIVDPRIALEMLGAGATSDDDERARRSWRAAYVAAHADRMVSASVIGVAARAAEPMALAEFTAFVDAAWAGCDRTEPILVSAIESLPA